jgi:hypothetical protein
VKHDNAMHFNGTLTRLQNLCGTEPHPVRFRAKKYKINEKFFTLDDFKY